ncbi:S8 family serine peptidase [Paracoccus sp. NSM]|uniref:S8 family serine peptidase n=1 Tax=Paracoccus sp. NSM TaxID=3457784 RepID=UPI004036D109
MENRWISLRGLLLAATLGLGLALPAQAQQATTGPAMSDALNAYRGEYAQSVLMNRRKSARASARMLRLPPLPPHRSWMSPEILEAWASGYRGQGARITVVDDFTGRLRLSGDLGTGTARLRHGQWVQRSLQMLAPRAATATHDLRRSKAVTLSGRDLNIINLSYGMLAPEGYDLGRMVWTARERSIIGHAQDGRAVIAKAAGNDGVALGSANGAGRVDYLNLALAGRPSALFVGALDRNGTPEEPASIASYSNRAGADPRFQTQFLTVGVRDDVTGLRGTSFAAPIVSGYAAVLGSKFNSAAPDQIASRLLETARSDTLRDYDPAIHGRGEASIGRAIAPSRID